MRRQLAVGVTVVVLAGCGGPDYDDASADLRAAQGRVTDQVLEVAAVLEAAGLEVTALSGERSGCSSAPRSGVDYRIGGSVVGGDPVSARLAATLAALEADGWTVVTERREDGRPGATLARDDRWLTVARTTLQASTALAFGATSECVRFPNDRIPDLSQVDAVPLRE